MGVLFPIDRPGLAKFMEKMSRLYEMHVYTMGTRSYADAICKVIDPDGRIFGGRVLSRDESGSESSLLFYIFRRVCLTSLWLSRLRLQSLGSVLTRRVDFQVSARRV